jgi:acetyl esterase/lipase
VRWLLLLGLLLMAPVARSEPAPLSAYMGQATQPPDATIPYGAAASQRVELFLPKVRGPHPVVVLLHGGCYLKEYAGVEETSPIARDLADRGFAVWNVGYRLLGEPGAGYPGTFEDVAVAIDRIRDEARRYDLDPRRVVVLGHSAGGHLGLWAAARPNLPRGSPLHRPDPLRIGAVISLAGIGDLEGQGDIFEHACGRDTFERLLGPAPSYADTSPARLLPFAAEVVMVHGEHDHVMPPPTGQAFARQVRASGGRAEVIAIPGAGHFDVVIPTTAAWRVVADRVALEASRLP